MASSNSTSVRESLRTWVDLLVVLAVVAATTLAVLLEAPVFVRLPLTALVVLVAPGYVLSIALFPADGPRDAAARPANESAAGISPLERAVVAVGLSLTVVPLLVIATDVVLGDISTPVVLAVVATLTLGALGVATLRRRATLPNARFTPLPARATKMTKASPSSHASVLSPWSGPSGSPGGSRVYGLVLVAVLCASLLFAGGAIAYSESVSNPGPGVTEFYFVSAADADADANATAYPTELERGEEQQVTLAIGNREHAETEYAVVGILERVSERDGETVVVDRRRTSTNEVTVAADGTVQFEDSVTPEEEGRYRLVYLLYVDGIPDDPSAENAYRDVHLWLDVTAASGDAANETATDDAASAIVDAGEGPVDTASAMDDAVSPEAWTGEHCGVDGS